MALGLARSSAQSIDGKVSIIPYNIDVGALFDAFAGLESQEQSLGALHILPLTDDTDIFKVSNAAGTELFSIDTTNSYIKIKATAKLYFDGGTDTYLQESAADILDIYVGGVNMMKFTEAATDKIEVLGSDLEIDATKKFYFDGGGNTYIHESAGDNLDFLVGGAENLSLQTSESVFNDGQADINFRIESDGNANMFFVDAGNDRIGIQTASPLALLHIGNGTVALTGPTVIINQTISPADNARGFADATQFNGASSKAYASFDSRGTSGGSNNLDHLINFQAAYDHGSSGTLGTLYGFGSIPENNGGTITNLYHHYVADCVGAGTVTNQYGLYIPNLAKGATLNYSIYTGTAPCYFGGKIDVVDLLTGNVKAKRMSGTFVVAYEGGAYVVHGSTIGVLIDAADDVTAAQIKLPDDCTAISKITICGRAEEATAGGDGMNLRVLVDGGADNEAWNTHNVDANPANSSGVNYAQNDTVIWEITSGVSAFTAGDVLRIYAGYDSATSGFEETNARIRCWEIEYT